MDWIKKNLFLLASGLIALGLLGVAGWFCYQQKVAVDAVTTQLNEQTSRFESLMTRDPHPNEENIAAAKREQQRVGELLAEARKHFVPAGNFTTNLDKETFRGFLETTIYQIERDAEKSGVTLPNNNKYDFTFKAQRGSFVFAPETLVPLAHQVAEIKGVCDVLFQARVHSLLSLRRVPVAKEDEGPTDFLVGKKPTTNAVTGAISTPYEIVFQGFTAELAGVLEGFYRTPHCFIVKNIDVQTNVATAVTAEGIVPQPYYQPYPYPAPSTAVPPQMSPGELMRRRYGLGPSGRPGSPMLERYGIPAPAPPPAAPAYATAARRGPETVLDERPLRITLFVESVRLPELVPSEPPRSRLRAAN
jgi:hypothetical protein